jgi:hypothetical protein
LYAPEPAQWVSFRPKCGCDGIKQSAVAKRLVQNLHGSLSERLLPDVFVLLTSDEDDGNRLSTTLQFLLKIKSGHSRHRDIEDQTPGLTHRIGREKRLPRRKGSSCKAELFQ